MDGFNRRDSLVVAVRARMIVGPTDRRAFDVVADMPSRIRILMLRVKEMRAPDSAERTQRRAEVLVIASGENAAATLVKTRDALAVSLAQSVSGINCKKPELVEVSRIEHTQNSVIPGAVNFPIASSDFIKRNAVVVFDRREMVAQ